ncbi:MULTISPECIES: DUF262 domain-containing protein [Yersinia]|uniref:DUF262 domain-containing protein n=1 Tax=Yersinia TaxID=629 RepID=UPI0005E6B776|nr:MULTISPECIES: DUF262 domain-containing protein [Yersinia]CNL00851.1 Uncharacterized conserved protein [Yersinia enterocolitica]
MGIINKKKSYTQDLAEEGVYSGVESEISNSDNEYSNTEPFNPDSISIASKVIALDTVLRRIKNNTIKLAPDFQRNFVWDHTRRSQLIESMILRIPLPMFYVSEDKNGVWEVVDGLQRLSTIRDFIFGPDGDGKGDKLQNLEFWGESLNGKTFFALERDNQAARIVNNILESELSFTIINPDTPEKVRRNIFKRINTGGMRLSDQEIRHALYQGSSTRLLKNLVESEEYKFVTQNTVKDNRMAGRELILRFLAFNILGRDNFKGDIDSFLSDTMIAINNGFDDGNRTEDIDIDNAINIDVNIDDVVVYFKIGLRRSYEIFDEHAFRKSLPGDSRKAPINKSLFEVWINILSKLNGNHYDKLIENKSFFLAEYEDILNDYDFSNTISRHGGSPVGSLERYNKFIELINKHIGVYNV